MDDLLTKPIRKLKKRRQRFLTSGLPNEVLSESYICSEEQLEKFRAMKINPRFKALLKFTDESLEFVKKMLKVQNKFFVRFMKNVAMSR